MSKVLRCTVIASLLFVAASLTAHGDEKYPTKPIRLIVPMAAGGGVDGLARVIAQQVGESLGQSVVVDNRTGGGGIIGVGMAIRATPDGYTLIMRTRMAREGVEPAGGPPEDFRTTVKRDVDKWKKVVKAANISIAQ